MALVTKKIILTGATGFVGSRFLNDFSAAFEIRPVSLRTTQISEIDFDGADAVLHCAALVHQMKGAPENEYFRINRDLTIELAAAARASGVKHFVFISTAHVFGDSGSLDHSTSYSPTSPCHPKDAYGRSKLAAEKALLDLETPEFAVSIIRPPMVYGEGAKGNLISLIKLIKTFPLLPFGYKKNRRSIIYIGNLTHFISLALQKRAQGIYLPQDAHPLSIYEIARLLAKTAKSRTLLFSPPEFFVRFMAILVPGITRRLFGTLAMDSSSSIAKLGYKPPFTTEAGFLRMFSSETRRKLRIARVVTAPEAVEFHLRNTLDLLTDEYDLEIIGSSVEKFRDRWPKVKWTNLDISRKVSVAADLKSLLKLIGHFSRNRYDIVHSIMPKAGLLVSLSTFITFVPIRLHTFTGQTWANKSGLLKKVFVFFDWVTVKLSTKCYTDSLSQSEFLLQNGIKYNHRALPVIGDGSLSGVSLERFNLNVRNDLKSRVRSELHIPEAATVFTFIGRKCADKGVFELLEAFHEVSKGSPDMWLLLVGPDDDPSFQKIFREYENQNSRIVNIGFSSQPELYIAGSDVFCLPSHREGFGSVIIEAAAMGVPAIGTRIPGLVDAVIENETGILVEKENLEELKRAILFLSQNPNIIIKFGKASEKRARDLFSAERLFTLLLAEYHHLSGNIQR